MARTEIKQINTSEPILKNKISGIRLLVRSFELRMKGYVWSESGNSYIYTGDVLAGTDVISKLVGLLSPYAEDSNLITNKEDEVFSRQKERTNKSMNAVLLNEMGCWARNYKIIVNIFMTTLQNIWDIIRNSKTLMKREFGNNEEESSYEDEYQ